MTNIEKQLLLKDLCARLPYYTELYSNVADGNWAILTPVVISNLMNATDELIIKPHLRPMSSMTEEEAKEFAMLQTDFYSDGWLYPIAAVNMVDWLNAHHFDFRGLIEKSLALEAPEDMYKTE